MYWTIKDVTTSSCLKYVVSRDFIPKNSVHWTSSGSGINLWHCFISVFFMSLLLKRKLSHMGHKWVIVGHIQIAQWVRWVNKCDPLSTLDPIRAHSVTSTTSPNTTATVMLTVSPSIVHSIALTTAAHCITVAVIPITTLSVSLATSPTFCGISCYSCQSPFRFIYCVSFQ